MKVPTAACSPRQNAYGPMTFACPPNTQNASMASARASGACYDPPMREAFRCPNCGAEYQIERVEAAPTHRRQAQVNCAECGGPLRNRDGKFVLKYRRDRSRQ